MEKETQNSPVRQEFCKLGHSEQGEGQGWAGLSCGHQSQPGCWPQAFVARVCDLCPWAVRMEVVCALCGCSSVGWCVCILVSINKAAQECLDTKGCFWLGIKYSVSSFLLFLLFFLFFLSFFLKKRKSSAVESEEKELLTHVIPM